MAQTDLNINSDITKIVEGLDKAVVSTEKLSGQTREYQQKSNQAFTSTENSLKEVNQAIKDQEKILKELNRESEKYAKRAAKLSADEQKAWKRLQGDIKVAGQEMAALKAKQDQLTPVTSKLSSAFTKLGAIAAAAFSVNAIVSYTKEAINLAATAEGVQRGFDKLNRPTLLDELRKATKGTVTDLELMKRAVEANNLKIPLEKMGALFEFAKKRADDTGQSIDYMVNSIVTGLGRKSTLRLDNVGLSLAEINTEVAKAGNFFDGVFNIIERENAKAGEYFDTTKDKLEQQRVASENLKMAWGNLSKELVTAVGPAINSTLKGLTDMLQGVTAINNVDTISFWEKIRIALAGARGDYQGLSDIVTENISQALLLERAFKQGAEGVRESFTYMTKDGAKTGEEAAKVIMEGYQKNMTKALNELNRGVIPAAERDKWNLVIENSKGAIAEIEKLLKDSGQSTAVIYEKQATLEELIIKMSTEEILRMRKEMTDRYGDLLNELALEDMELGNTVNKDKLSLIDKELNYRKEGNKKGKKENDIWEKQEKDKYLSIQRTIEDYYKSLEKAINQLNEHIDIDLPDPESEDVKAWKDTFQEIYGFAQDSYDATVEAQRAALNKQLEQLEAFKQYLSPQDYLAALDAIQNRLSELFTFAEKHPIAAALGFTDEKQLDQIKDYVGQLFDFASQMVDQQVQATERIVNDQNQRIDEQQELVNKEFSLKEEGLANNYRIEQENLQKMQAARDAAIKDREKAIRLQRTMATVESGISLVTAAANIMKGFSGIPIVGVVLGLAAVAAMIAGFVAAQGKVKEATQMKKGGRLIGPSHSQGGMRIEGTNYEVEGREWFVNARSSEKYNDLLTSINKDDQKGLQVAVNRHNLLKAFPVQARMNIDDSQKLGEIVRLMKSGDGVFMGNGFYIEKKGTMKKTIRLN